MMANWKAGVAGLVTLFALIGGVATGVEYFAKDADLKLVEYRLEQKISGDRAYELQQQIWQLEDRHHGADLSIWPQADRDRYRKLQLQLQKLKGL
jgi:hypothetical protein